MKLNDLKIDAKRRHEGGWVPLGDFDGRIKVRGARNFDWLKVAEAETRRIAKRDDVRGTLDPKQQREVLIECILQAGLLDWDGDLFTDDDGKVIAYSPAKAAEIYKDPSFEVLVDLTVAACEGMAYASAVDEKAAEKN